jgi:undecaprenyl diphosphate synthase
MERTEHIAIIPDGNRRWAKERGLLPWEGHREGLKRVEEIVRFIKDTEITHLSVWGGSYNNLTKRTKKEIAVLDLLYRETAKKLLNNKEVFSYQVRVRCLGEWKELLKQKTVEAIEKLEEKTKHFANKHLTLLIGYNGDREMLEAIRSIALKKIKTIDDEMVKKHLWSHDLPPIDLVIRTGGEPHLSTGFMMWDTRNAHLYFSDKMWPSFAVSDFKKAVAEYRKREKRRGK